MFSQSTVQIAVIILVIFSISGLAATLFLPRFLEAKKAGKRLDLVSTTRNPGDRRAAADENRRKRSVEDTLKEIEETQRQNRGQKPTLTVRMRQAGLKWTKNGYIIISVLVALFSFIASITSGYLTLLPSLGIGLVGGLLIPHLYVNFMRKRQFKRFLNEFPNAVDVIVRGVKAGLPLIDCMKVIASDSSEPVRSEFREIIEDQTLGLPMDQAVNKLNERIPLPEANFFTIVIAIQSRSGGSLSEALGNLSKVLRDRKKMQAKIKAMSSEAKTSAGIIGCLPILVILAVYFTTPSYITLLFETFLGNIVLGAGAFWMLMGIMVMRKMINFDF